MTGDLMLDAIGRTRATREQIEAALESGDLRSLAPVHVEAWRRSQLAKHLTNRDGQ